MMANLGLDSRPLETQIPSHDSVPRHRHPKPETLTTIPLRQAFPTIVASCCTNAMLKQCSPAHSQTLKPTTSGHALEIQSCVDQMAPSKPGSCLDEKILPLLAGLGALLDLFLSPFLAVFHAFSSSITIFVLAIIVAACCCHYRCCCCCGCCGRRLLGLLPLLPGNSIFLLQQVSYLRRKRCDYNVLHFYGRRLAAGELRVLYGEHKCISHGFGRYLLSFRC